MKILYQKAWKHQVPTYTYATLDKVFEICYTDYIDSVETVVEKNVFGDIIGIYTEDCRFPKEKIDNNDNKKRDSI